ncbi:T9SS type A sorting domain-containing protein [Kaistella antarctica]|uniref:Delta-60 repeat domain n=1 Tax=Kaistella antarctica TaxID=266748 RepID=A0A448NPM7_9FLAO|nr:T9SS type A sorting domain-containing protein [Kaistella antarctica]KEY19379.1 hypothetical protein HY04_13325 [Kaistella antarctica]SEW06245.1 Por secretion system C-terminal sorting domain-containing protein [Kaistella antarctica]VEH97620.1 delta-60 repeat domain [Kaistella antarctica]
MKKLYFLLILVSFIPFLKSQKINIDPTYNISSTATDIPHFGNGGEVYNFPEQFENRVMRFTPTGNFDPNFGVDGYLSLLPLYTHSNIEITSSGIYTLQYGSQTSNTIVKYTLFGTIDTSFGINGSGRSAELFTLNSGIVAQKLIVNSDNSIYVLTTGNRIIKILPTGLIDSEFGTKIFNYNVTLLQSNDNSLLLRYNNLNKDIITRYTPQGNLDISFGNSGELIIEIPVGFVDIFTNKLNEFFILNRSEGIHNITKYTANGKDLSFATNGTLSLNYSSLFPGSNIFGLSKIDFDSNNKILLFGTISYTYGQFAGMILLQYNVDGLPNNTFNDNKNYFMTPEQSNQVPYRNFKIIDDNTFLLLYLQSFAAPRSLLNVSKYLRSDALNTSESNVINKVEIYPNPVADFVNVKVSPTEKLKKINIYSIDGRLIFTSTELKNNLEFLSPGNYIVEIITNRNKYSQKLIKK